MQHRIQKDCHFLQISNEMCLKVKNTCNSSSLLVIALQGPLRNTQHSDWKVLEAGDTRWEESSQRKHHSGSSQLKKKKRKKEEEMASETHTHTYIHIPAETRTLCTWTARKHTHAHVHLHSEANPSSTVEVRCSQICRGCNNNNNPELFFYTETTKLSQDLTGSKGSFWHTVKGWFPSPAAGGVY